LEAPCVLPERQFAFFVAFFAKHQIRLTPRSLVAEHANLLMAN
jgi:hypothetical protein